MMWKVIGALVLTIIIFAVFVFIILKQLSPSDKSQGIKNQPEVKSTKTEEVTVVIDISVGDADLLIKENADSGNFVILDVRKLEEFQSGYIENAVNIDYSSQNFKNEVGKLDKAKTYFVYCRSGNRSREAIKIMKDLGFENIYNLESGMSQWQAEGLPTIK